MTMGIMWLLFTIELAFAAASIFKTERMAHTLSTLAVLPMSLRRIALHKMLGILPTLLPTVTYFAIGFVCVADEIFKGLADLTNSNRGNVTFLLFLGYTFAQSIFFLHLTADLSLRVKRGALPLAIAVEFIIQFFLSFAFFAAFRDEWAFAPLIVLTIFAILFLHHDIFQRLEMLAAEE